MQTQTRSVRHRLQVDLRAEDLEWMAHVKAKAFEEGTTIPELVRRLLQDYAAEHMFTDRKGVSRVEFRMNGQLYWGYVRRG